MKRELAATLVIIAASFTTNASAAVELVGNWKFEQTVDAVTDKISARAWLTSADGSVLNIQCDEAGPNSVYPLFFAKDFLGGDGADYDHRKLIVRFDAGSPVETNWIYKDRIAFLHPVQSAGDVAAFRAAASQSTKIVIRAFTYEFAQVDAVFDATGAADAIARVGKACKD